MVETLYHLFCDGERRCPHRKVPYRNDEGFCVMPVNIQMHLAIEDGWSKDKHGNLYCPICTGNRKLYEQMKLPLLLTLFTVLFTNGCASDPRRSIAFESIPPGAIIHFNKDYVGQTPCSVEIEANGDGTFKGGKVPWLYDRFTAEPATNEPGLFPQEVDFRRSGILIPGEKVPSRIFFDLRKEPPPAKKTMSP